MDINGNGKHDWQDDMIYFDMMNDNSESSKNSTYQSGRKYTGRASLFDVSALGKVVICIVIIFCISFIFSGYADAIDDLLGYGVIAFLIVKWLTG